MAEQQSSGKPLSLAERISQARGGASALAQQATGVNTTNISPSSGNKAEALKQQQKAAAAKELAAQAARKASVIAVPTPKSNKDVIFRHPTKANFGTATTGGRLVKFVNGYFMTDHEPTIAFMRSDAAKLFGFYEVDEKGEKKN